MKKSMDHFSCFGCEYHAICATHTKTLSMFVKQASGLDVWFPRSQKAQTDTHTLNILLYQKLSVLVRAKTKLTHVQRKKVSRRRSTQTRSNSTTEFKALGKGIEQYLKWKQQATSNIAVLSLPSVINTSMLYTHATREHWGIAVVS